MNLATKYVLTISKKGQFVNVIITTDFEGSDRRSTQLIYTFEIRDSKRVESCKCFRLEAFRSSMFQRLKFYNS